MDSKFNLIISSILAIFIYILIILLVLFYLKPEENIEVFSGLQNQSTIEFEIISDIANTTTSEEANLKKQLTTESNDDIKAIDDTVSSNIKSLFSDIKSDINTQKISKQVSISSGNLDKKFELKNKQDQKDKNIELSKMIDIEHLKSQSQSTSSLLQGKMDSYYSKISSLILSRWYRIPLVVDTKYLVSANIKIDTFGNFSFSMIKYSGNRIVDEAIVVFLKNQSLETYPVSPDGLSKSIRINFIPYDN